MGTQANNRAEPGYLHYAVTPSDTTIVDAKALYVTVTGNVAIMDAGGTSITYLGVPVGLFPFSATRVLAATTATVVAWK